MAPPAGGNRAETSLIRQGEDKLSVVPVMVVYLIFQEKVTDAMVNSGMKG